MRITPLISFFLLFALTTQSQTTIFNGSFSIREITGSSPSYTVDGFFQSEGTYIGTDIQEGDRIYFWHGNDCDYLVVDTVYYAYANIVNLGLSDPDTTFLSIPTGKGLMTRLTDYYNFSIPFTADVPDVLKKCVGGKLINEIDQIRPQTSFYADSIFLDTTGLTYINDTVLQVALEQIDSALFDINDSLDSIPRGSGTANQWAYWLDANTLTTSNYIVRDATRLTLNAPVRFQNLATIGLPGVPLKGDVALNETVGNIAYYVSAWEYPVKSANSNGLFTAGSLVYANAAGRLAEATPFLHLDYTNLRLGIGTPTPGNKITVSFTGSDQLFESHDFISTYTGSSTAVGGRYRMTMPAGTSASGFIAQSNEVRTATGATTNTGQIGGFNNLALTRHSSGTIASAVGSLDQAYHTGAGTVTLGKGIEGNAVIEGSGTMTTGVGVMGRLQVTGGGTMTNGYGLYVENATVTASTLTNNYALFIKNQTVGTNKFAIWSLSTSDSYLAGQLGLGTTEPDHPLHIFSNDVNFITEALIENNYTGYQARVLNYRRNRDVNMSANDIAGAFSFAGYHNSTRNPNGQIFSNIEGIYRGDGTTRAGAVLINTWDGIGKKGRLYVDENGFTTISREVSGLSGHIGIRLGVRANSTSTDIFSVRDSADINKSLFSVQGDGSIYSEDGFIKIGGAFFTQTVIDTVNNTASETSLINTGVGTTTLPADYLEEGRDIKCEAWGTVTTNGSPPSLELNLKLGSTAVWDSGSFSMIDLSAGIETWYANISFTTYTEGVSGTVMPAGEFSFFVGGDPSFGKAIRPVYASPVTINTTTSQTIDFTATWGSADPNASIVMTKFVCKAQN